MSTTIKARTSARKLRKLADRCSSRTGWSLAAGLIPQKGANAIQSDKVHELARKAMRGTRTR